MVRSAFESVGRGDRRNVTRVQLRGPEELKRIAQCVASCRGEVVERYTTEELIILQRAVWRCEWVVFIDQLTNDQREAALLAEEVPAFVEEEKGLVPVPSSLAEPSAVYEWLRPRSRGGAVDAVRANELSAAIKRRNETRG